MFLINNKTDENHSTRHSLFSKNKNKKPSFKIKQSFYATMIGILGSSCLIGDSLADTTYYTADSSNTTISSVGLSTNILSNAILATPTTGLTLGSYIFNYVVVQFTALETGTYYVGQTYATTDTVMILYNGIYDANNPGTNVISGNDDTSQAAHQNVLGTDVSVSCTSNYRCPQIQFSVVAGVTYSLFVSTYRYSNSSALTIPFEFYSTGSVTFNTYTGRSPIDLMQSSYNASELGLTVDPIFAGGILMMDQANAIYTDDFTLANISSSTIDQNGNVSVFTGVFSDAESGSPGYITIDNSGNGGSVTFSGINTYTGSTTLKGGILTISADANLGDPSATLVFDGGTLLTAASFDSSRSILLNSTGTINIAGNAVLTLSGTASGDGSIEKTGTGLLLVNGQNTYTGTTTITEGIFAVGDSSHTDATLSGDVIVATNAVLAGYGSVTGSVQNNGIMAIGSTLEQLADGSLANFTVNGNLINSGAILLDNSLTTGNTLTINGDYAGNTGSITLATSLEGDSSSTDKVVITGDATGSTTVYVNNLTGSGAQTVSGIELIDVGGVSDSNAFVQGNRIVAGAYEYSLYKGSDIGAADSESWFLTSLYVGSDPNSSTNSDSSINSNTTGRTRVLRPESASYIANVAAVNNMFNQRLHERQTQYIGAGDAEHNSGIWFRYNYGHNRFKDGSGQLKTKTDRNLLQMGGDVAKWSSNSNNQFIVGVMGGYGRSSSDTDSSLSSRHSSAETEGYSVGVYGTWFADGKNKSGWYADSWMLWNNFDAEVQGDELAKESYHIKGLTGSLEAGYALPLTMTKGGYGIWIQPNAQLTWMGAKANERVENNGTVIAGSRGNLQSRVGIRGYMTPALESTAKMVFKPYAELNWLHNTKPYAVTMNSATVEQDGTKNIGEVKVGLDASVNKRVNLWGSFSQQTGSHSYHDTMAAVGVKVTF